MYSVSVIITGYIVLIKYIYKRGFTGGGGIKPSIYFTNQPYFYRPSATDQMIVLFRRGPWIAYAGI